MLARAILHHASKYIENLDISALKLSVFGGDVVLRNLELKLDVLRREFASGLPIEFKRGFVRELRIRIPWLKLHSEPIEVSFDIVELVASLLGPADEADSARVETPATAAPLTESSDPGLAAATSKNDGWMHSLVAKALCNAVLRVRNVVIKFVHANAVATLSFREIELLSAGAQWQRAFVEPEG